MKRVLAPALVALFLGAVPAATPAAAPAFSVLVFTKTTGYRHASIPVAIKAVQDLGAQNGFAVGTTEDAATFTDAGLAKYKVVVFLLTTGDVLDDNQQLAFQRFVQAGNGFVGVHSAADTEYDWPWYHTLLGATFKTHPPIQQATVHLADTADPLNAGLPADWVRSDEWYVFQSNPRSAVHVLATVDETTYDPGDEPMGADHPIAWTHLYDGGRAWYSAMGHADAAWSEPLFLTHVLAGIKFAAMAPVPHGIPQFVQDARIVSLKTTVTGRRVFATVRHPDCSCVAVLWVSVQGHTRTTRVAAKTKTTRVASGPLPPGRWRLTLTLNSRFGAKAVVQRWITVR